MPSTVYETSTSEKSHHLYHNNSRVGVGLLNDDDETTGEDNM